MRTERKGALQNEFAFLRLGQCYFAAEMVRCKEYTVHCNQRSQGDLAPQKPMNHSQKGGFWLMIFGSCGGEIVVKRTSLPATKLPVFFVSVSFLSFSFSFSFFCILLGMKLIWINSASFRCFLYAKLSGFPQFIFLYLQSLPKAIFFLKNPAKI